MSTSLNSLTKAQLIAAVETAAARNVELAQRVEALEARVSNAEAWYRQTAPKLAAIQASPALRVSSNLVRQAAATYRDEPCQRCNATGVYQWGEVRDGVPAFAGTCYRCNGSRIARVRVQA